MPLKTHLQKSPVIDHQATGADYCAKRTARGLTRSAMASAMMISTPYLFDLEQGRRNWNADLAKRADAALRGAK